MYAYSSQVYRLTCTKTISPLLSRHEDSIFSGRIEKNNAKRETPLSRSNIQVLGQPPTHGSLDRSNTQRCAAKAPNQTIWFPAITPVWYRYIQTWSTTRPRYKPLHNVLPNKRPDQPVIRTHAYFKIEIMWPMLMIFNETNPIKRQRLRNTPGSVYRRDRHPVRSFTPETCPVGPHSPLPCETVQTTNLSPGQCNIE